VYRSVCSFTGISHEKVFAGIPKRNSYDSIEQVPFQGMYCNVGLWLSTACLKKLGRDYLSLCAQNSSAR